MVCCAIDLGEGGNHVVRYFRYLFRSFVHANRFV